MVSGWGLEVQKDLKKLGLLALCHWRKIHSSDLYSHTPWRERTAKRRSSLQIASDP